MFAGLARKLFGSANDRRVKSYRPRVDEINALEGELEKLSDEALRARTDEFKKQLADGKTLDDILVPAFATCREAAKRTLGQRHFDVQLIGGMILHEGRISEMKTGEGKTLVATLPVYLNALAGRGVHVVTVNDYLAKRDAEWMGQIYGFLGLTVGVIVHGLEDPERKAAYACDVTYGTNNELGFDYLRDNMKYRVEDMVQRGHVYAIVDEVDSILIDEARTPLIISGPLDDRSDFYNTIDTFIPNLDKADFEVDEKQRTVNLSEGGMSKMEQALRDAKLLKSDSLYDVENVSVVHHINQALRAHKLFAARQGLHRAQRRGRHHRRVHRPHDAGKALLGRAASGAGGEGAPADPAREPDARLDHVPELLPHVRQARRHDRHGAHRSRRVPRHLQSRSPRSPDQHAARARRSGRRGLSHQRGEIPRDHHAAGGEQDQGPAGAGRHHLDREVRTARRDAAQGGLGAARLLRPERVRGALHRRRGRQEDQGLRGAQRALPRAGSLHRIARPACRARSRSRPTWRAAAPTFSSAAMPTCASGRNCPTSRITPRACAIRAPTRSGRRWQSSRRSRFRPAGCSCSAPSATRAGASTTSCAAVPAARATRAAPSSSCRSKTT